MGGLGLLQATAPQLTQAERWAALVRDIVTQIIAATKKIYPPPRIVPATLMLLASG